nr:MAG TPA: hypothetical protein [Crassvirales sp.]
MSSLFSCFIINFNSFYIINSSHFWVSVPISSASFTWSYRMCF